MQLGKFGSPATTSPAAGTATSAPASPATAATPGTIPNDVRSPMRPGKYATVQFRPPFTFSTTMTAAGGADTPDVANFSLKIYGNSNFAGFYFLGSRRCATRTRPAGSPPRRISSWPASSTTRTFG